MADPLKPSRYREEESQFRDRAPVPLSFQVHNSGFWVDFLFSFFTGVCINSSSISP